MKKEIIVSAAIWFKDGKQYNDPHGVVNIDSGYVLSGVRHGCIFSQHGIIFGVNHKTHLEHPEQGFITNHRNFLNRQQAALLHIENGGKLHYSSKELFSEDLY